MCIIWIRFPSRKQLWVDAWRNGREAHRRRANSWEALESDLVCFAIHRRIVGVTYGSWKFIIFCGSYCCTVAFMQPTRHCPSVDRHNCASRLTGASGRAICHEHPRLISGRIIRPLQFRRCRLRCGNSCESSSLIIHVIVVS